MVILLLKRDTINSLSDKIKYAEEAINEFQKIPLFKIKPNQYKVLIDSLSQVESAVDGMSDSLPEYFHAPPSFMIEFIDFFSSNTKHLEKPEIKNDYLENIN
jgi:hypothetical protein